MSLWKPKTELGMKVKSGEITNIDQILESGQRILEPEIVDALLPGLESDLLALGQSKGKFGGGKKSIWRQTQKKSKEGNKPSFATMAVVGNRDGYVGIGMGKGKETMPAREKAIRRAKLSIIKVRRGCGSWECGCGESHSLPFATEGKSGSVVVKVGPAPKGANLVMNEECKKIFNLAGIKDVYSKIRGKSSTKINVLKACFKALQNQGAMKVRPEAAKRVGLEEKK
ncbi:30S ribosomal protein S5 [Candidatus Woesearchaeota archaeon]|nr:MAG: 30S ribosomal protein S5 [Candidatus Woesearchaeota archaeon]